MWCRLDVVYMAIETLTHGPHEHRYSKHNIDRVLLKPRLPAFVLVIDRILMMALVRTIWNTTSRITVKSCTHDPEQAGFL